MALSHIIFNKMPTILKTTSPPTRVNNDLRLTMEQRQLLAKHKKSFEGRSYVNPVITGASNDGNTFFHAPFLQHSFIYIITETLGDHPHQYFTEKTWKAMTSCTPFMLVGARHSLKKLHEFGFMTFNDWVDESYDDLETVADRITRIVNETKRLSEIPIEELTNIRHSMRTVLEHNFHHLKVFAQADLDNLRKNI